MIEVLITATILCSFDNYDTSSVCTAPPAYFEEIDGEFFGELESGIPFSQTTITNSHFHLQRFQLQNYFHYVSDKGVFYADNDLQALSKYLAT